MILVSANPTTGPRKRAAAPKGGTMKKRRSAAQKAATARLVAANKRRHRNPSRTYKAKRRYHRNPAPAARRRRVHRNPSFLGGFGGSGVLKEILSMEGAIMIGAAFAAPLTIDWVQEKVMPTATGWTKLGVKAATALLGAYLIQKFGKKPKAALAFGVTAGAVLLADAWNLYQGAGTAPGVSGLGADALAMQPGAVQALAWNGYRPGLSESMGYRVGLAGPASVGAFNRSFR